MRRIGFWVPVGAIAVLGLALWGLWTWRLGVANQDLALALEADHQRNFNEMSFHVEQIQSMLGKGLVTANVRQNMRYMSDVHNHSQAAVNNFTALPLPTELSASMGKFLQQTGDFAQSVLRNEAAGRDLDEKGRAELARLRQESVNLSASLQEITSRYNQGRFRWNPPMRLTWANLMQGYTQVGKPATGNQAPQSILPGGWDQVGTTMEKLPVMVYDGPFSEHIAKRSPAMAGPPVSREEAQQRLGTYVPNANTYRVTGVTEVGGTVPSFSFQLTPGNAAGNAYTASVDVARNGGYLVQYLNSRMVGKAALDMNRARDLGLEYLERTGFTGMVPTYGQVMDGTATIAYAYRENNVLVYPDQIKVKVALDNGEILAVDARQYVMSHHARSLTSPRVSVQEAAASVRPELQVQRTQMALIPDQAGTGEILTYEFLTTFGQETFLVYINANTGQEEQILQQIQTDGGTFAL